MNIDKDKLYELLLAAFLAGQTTQLHVNQRVDAAKDHADRVLRDLENV